MVTRRQAVGAHYGLKDWLVQRVTAVVMALYTLLVLAILLVHGGLDHGTWLSLFANSAFRLATFVFMVSLLYHAWIGMRNIWMDYISPVWARLSLQTITVLWLVACAVWSVQILWRV